MTRVGKIIAVGAVAVAALGARSYFARYGVALASTWLPTLGATSVLPHYDHRPRHDGLVLMDGDTHFEVVLDNRGRCSVYFTDAARSPLPASFAAQVRIAVTQTGYSQETTPLQIDAADTRWTGRGTPIEDANAVVRIAYTAGERSYWIDVPVSAWPGVIASLPR